MAGFFAVLIGLTDTRRFRLLIFTFAGRSSFNEPSSPLRSGRSVPSKRLSSLQLLDQGLCDFQIGGIEPLSKPAVDRGQQLARVFPPTLLTPQPRQTCRGAQ